MTPPLPFVFGIHLHQPVGNFDSVFADHLDRVYSPLLDALGGSAGLRFCLHLSGPLLDWLEHSGTAFLDQVGHLVSAGRIELLLSGADEPILAMLSRADRAEQVERMRERLARRFGFDARTLWLTERVWEPDLPADLVPAGVEAVLVDDRHLELTGIPRQEIGGWYRTEADGRDLALLPIDRELRYRIPFRPPADGPELLARWRAEGRSLAVLVDDGEKFGGWPGTHEWVWRGGWMHRFLQSMERSVEAGEVRWTTPSEVLHSIPCSGPAYLPSASYHEMEAWALPPKAARQLESLEQERGSDRLEAGEGALIRGTHWRNFLVRYPESRRMHRRMMELSRWCRRRGDPAEARRAIGRAQCNDAYWHGVFGGLYLRHLRESIWHHLAWAEGLLREGEGLGWRVEDVDGDGFGELRITSSRFSAVVAPSRGGVVEELTLFEQRINLAATLTRRLEAYHREAHPPGPPHRDRKEAGLWAPFTAASGGGSEPTSSGGGADPGIASIHEGASRALPGGPALDPEERGLFADRILAKDGRTVLHSWRGVPFSAAVAAESDGIVVRLHSLRGPALRRELHFDPGGLREVRWDWDPALAPTDASFASEVSRAAPLDLEFTGPGAIRSEPITTLFRSEQGVEEVVQGESDLLLFPFPQGSAGIRLHLPGDAPRPATAD